MKVQFFKQDTVNKKYRADLFDAIDNLILKPNMIVSGLYTKKFEAEFAEYLDCQYCSFLSNGLDALILALKAIGAKPGDSIIVLNHTYIATWLAPLSLGCNLIVAPVCDDSFLLDSSVLEEYITSSVKCIMPVHLYGNSCNMDRIMAVADKHSLAVVEDAAQAHGSSTMGRRIGSWGHATCFSFYPTKNLGALGEAGAVTTDDIYIDQAIKELRNYGRSSQDSSLNPRLGGNHRGDELQAALLSSKLRDLDYSLTHRRLLIRQYQEFISEHCPQWRMLTYDNSSAPHLAVLCTESYSTRNLLMTYLKDQNIDTSIHYPRPCHDQPCIPTDKISIDSLCKKQAESIAARIISLPMSEYHSTEEVAYVCKHLKAFNERGE